MFHIQTSEIVYISFVSSLNIMSLGLQITLIHESFFVYMGSLTNEYSKVSCS